jgi:hypothetical protein
LSLPEREAKVRAYPEKAPFDLGMNAAVWDAAIMGKFDRRHSMKMRRRKAQVKKKERLARKAAAANKKPAASPAKKTKKAPAAKAAASST